MNCTEIASILDNHEARTLDAERRAAAEAHIAACRSCAEVWWAANVAAREKFRGAPSGFFGDIVNRLEHARSMEASPSRRHRWITPVGLLAASVVLAWGLAVVLDSRTSADRGEYSAEAPPAADIREADLSRLEVSPNVFPDVSPATRFELGRHYEALPNPYPGAAAAGQVEVIEFFMYGCYPCYAFEPHLEAWDAAKADYIELIRVPVVFNAQARMHAQAFYAAEALGKLDAMHAAFFTEIHASGNRLDSERAMAELFARFGVGEQAFRAAFGSPEVRSKVERAIELVRSYEIPATPALVVGERYLTSPTMTGSYEAAFHVVDELSESLRSAGSPVRDRCRAAEPACGSAGPPTGASVPNGEPCPDCRPGPAGSVF